MAPELALDNAVPLAAQAHLGKKDKAGDPYVLTFFVSCSG